MTTKPAGDLGKQLDRLSGMGVVGNRSDGSLLKQIVCQRGEQAQAAFTVLVERHGPMVLGVCRHALGNSHDADDAFSSAASLQEQGRAWAWRRRRRISAWGSRRNQGEVSESKPSPRQLRRLGQSFAERPRCGDFALLVDHDRMRNAIHAIRLEKRPPGSRAAGCSHINADRVRELELFHHFLDRAQFAAGRMNADDDDVFALLLVQRRERRQVVAARPAPLGPEVEDHNLPAQVALRQPFAVQPGRVGREWSDLFGPTARPGVSFSRDRAKRVPCLPQRSWPTPRA